MRENVCKYIFKKVENGIFSILLSKISYCVVIEEL